MGAGTKTNIRRNPPIGGTSHRGLRDRARTLRRSDRWTCAAILVLIVGFGVRAASLFPSHKYLPDADTLIMGLRALEVLEGEPVVFYSHLRLGALEAYLHAAAFSLLGPSREALAWAPLFSGCLFVLFGFAFLLEVFGKEVAVLGAVFLAVPSPAFLYWTYMPNSYPETMALCAAVLFLAARAVRRGSRTAVFLVGLAAGLGFWNSVQTLTCSVPALVWLVRKRPESVRRLDFWLPLFGGAVLGALPWILYNLLHPLDALQGFHAPRLTLDPRALLSNLTYLVTTNLPELVTGTDPAGVHGSSTAFQRLLRPFAAAIYAAALWSLLRHAASRPASPLGAQAPASRPAARLLVIIALAIGAAFVLSNFGSERGQTVRYVLPLWPVIAGALALLTRDLLRLNRAGAAIAVAVLLAFNLTAYAWPGSDARRGWEEDMRGDAELVTLLQEGGIEWVFGDYWTVYPINFLSGRRIRGVPRQPTWDYLGYKEQLPKGSVQPWALVTRTAEEMDDWIYRAGLTGRRLSIDGGFVLFLPSSPPQGVFGSRQIATHLQKMLGPG
ncbi:MAG: ArnT family glycosyltransferase [Thermoanaerobaculia bacterium]